MKWYFCWRCQCDVPMLEEKEWAEMAPLLTNPIQRIKAYREKHGCDLKVAQQHALKPASEKYLELTGFKESNVNAIYHHRLSAYGPECSNCGHLFRTVKAKFCANCGNTRENN